MKTKPTPVLIAREGNVFTVQGATDTYKVDLTNPSYPNCHSTTTGLLCRGFEIRKTCSHITFARDIQAAHVAPIAGVAVGFMADVLAAPVPVQMTLEEAAALDHKATDEEPLRGHQIHAFHGHSKSYEA